MIDSTAVCSASSLCDQIDVALATNPFVNRRNLRVEAEHGRVVLRGEVTSYYQKQMAQESVRRIDGVQYVENLLEVTWA